MVVTSALLHACILAVYRSHLLTMLLAHVPDEGQGDDEQHAHYSRPDGTCRIVLISGFESFNVDLYKQASPCCLACHAWQTLAPKQHGHSARSILPHECHQHTSHCDHMRMPAARKYVSCLITFVSIQAAQEVARRSPGVNISVFSDRDLTAKRKQVEAALDGADVFFGSLLFDFDQVWQPDCCQAHVKCSCLA